MFATTKESKIKKNNKIMKHRQFKVPCYANVNINRKECYAKDLRAIKKAIYTYGERGKTYEVKVRESRNDKILDIYLMRYTTEGPIFQKQIYSLWKELAQKAKMNQNILNFYEI